MAERMIIDGITRLNNVLQEILFLINSKNKYAQLQNHEGEYLEIIEKLVNINIVFGYLDDQFFFFNEIEKKEELSDFNLIYEEVVSMIEINNNFEILERGIYITNNDDIKELRYSYFLYSGEIIIGIQQTYNNSYFVPAIIPIIRIKTLQETIFPINIYQ